MKAQDPQGFSQLDAAGRLRHLITLAGLDGDLVRELLARAQHYVTRPGQVPAHGKDLAGFTVANLFTEPSTRTRASFELAAKRLSADVVNVDVMLSSRVKGESMLDTIYTLQAMDVDVFVIRDAQPGVTQYVAEHVADHVSVVSGGEAHLSHPTQGLLDALTMLQFKGGFRDLVVSIVGDIRHSRVARSAAQVLGILGVGELRLIGPDELMPDAHEFPGAQRFSSLDAGIDHADVVMILRIQNERMEQARIPDAAGYFERFGLTPERLRRARPEAIVMHPGPMNRGVEIASEVADGPQSVIRRQVANGVAVRMAVLSHLAAARRSRG
ncbi:MAG: aspartate carbamoyltransferase catalytic subunit [Steroidobacteraceae bacterium]|jgi:aspartate carbamoyltransferase catalytic subunit|nr:aspartate carbamoyltransferase catalytic subunit [Steroidobacteraceae bacterium]